MDLLWVRWKAIVLYSMLTGVPMEDEALLDSLEKQLIHIQCS